MYEYRKRGIVYAIFFAILIFSDQFSKYIIRLRQLAGDGFYICNENVAFGIKISSFVFWPAAIIAVIILILAFKNCFISVCISSNPKMDGRYSPLYLSLALAGVLSNLVDRLIFGCVIDFIDLKIWPLFNLADMMIVAGVILLVIHNFRKSSTV